MIWAGDVSLHHSLTKGNESVVETVHGMLRGNPIRVGKGWGDSLGVEMQSR